MDDIIPIKSREVKHCPPHFIKVSVRLKKSVSTVASLLRLTDEASVEDRCRNWLHENVENRFFIGMHVDLTNNVMVESFLVAFEEPKDATYFTLLLPSLKDED